VTIAPIHSLAAAVLAGRAEPTLLIRSGLSPHTFALKPTDAATLKNADIIVWIGPALEASLARSLRGVRKTTRIIELSRLTALTRHDLRATGAGHMHDPSEHGGHHRDPHLWLSPANAHRIVTELATVLAQEDPAYAERYRANAAETAQRLAKLNARMTKALAPVKAKPFMVLHDAFQYLDRHFELAMAGAVAISPDRNPGARRIAALRRQITQKRVVCIFSEPQFPSRLTQLLAAATNVRSATLDPLGADLLPGPDLYFTLMDRNAGAIVNCLSDP
jgi:zinc transport system substrate-binding protein